MIFKEQRKALVHRMVDLRRIDTEVRTWPALVKATGKTDERFCIDNGLQPASFSRWCAGLQLPGWDTVEKVRAAFRAEGVM